MFGLGDASSSAKSSPFSLVANGSVRDDECAALGIRFPV